MAGRVRVLYALFEGLPETVIDSQVAEHIRSVRDGLGWEFELWAVDCSASGFARSLRRRDAVAAHTGCRVRVLRGVRPAVPLSRRLNRLRLARALGNGRPPFDLIHARTDYTAAVVGPIARRHGLPMIWDCRGDRVAEFEARSGEGGAAKGLLRRWRCSRPRSLEASRARNAGCRGPSGPCCWRSRRGSLGKLGRNPLPVQDWTSGPGLSVFAEAWTRVYRPG